jgi:adenine-specific DNA-methyltransferase
MSDTPTITLHKGDALDVLKTLPDNSVHAVITDPPYFRVLGEPWDNQWDDHKGFTNWLTTIAQQWQRVLVPNGSLYCFASPQMVARVELNALEPAGFVTLNRIVWAKTNAVIYRGNREGLTQYHSGDNERILFAQPLKEHAGATTADNAYANAMHKLRCQVFAPLREYLAGERDRRGLKNREIDTALGTNGMASHWFDTAQWCIPSAEKYRQLRDLFNDVEGDYLTRDWTFLRREYEDLHLEYETLRVEFDQMRRPFDLGPESKQRPRGEVWTYAPPGATIAGRHPCQKPENLLRHIIQTSTKPGQTILDTFAGSGSTGVVAYQEGRHFVGVELSDKWHQVATENLETAQKYQQRGLFDD